MNTGSGRRILILDGHPDPDPARLIHALADAYAEGARQAGHAVTRLDVARLAFAPLRSAAEWEAEAPPDVAAAQAALAAAEHIVILTPLWLGDIPAALKAFFEQVLRPGFAFPRGARGLDAGLLRGRSVRLVVTMGMPAMLYRVFFRAHSLRSLERNTLRFVGLKPVRWTLLGNVAGGSPARRQAWLDRLRKLGAAAA
ncbi:NAD(P)H-dependent oxidoreductase [Roseomonas frigidaquae]|uniref:NAD(P)H-dependent oxidoreductase n=1 Tax=Falsiroseomonas frigidaquae TaxID=487318 RepID=A0ABX1F0D7_9PROT|nr:NAD(P)H-dependent oxidoreductase [Falsiroseomonas frigidaquae]NKE45769.1 NAD(P)H-dependent oxidoreductase [Falsiroseomonas frigidaquae]